VTSSAGEYLRRFSDLLLASETTDADGARMDLDVAASAVVEQIRQVGKSGGKVLLIGNGGSAAVASHMQNDICKAAGIRAMVFTEQPLLTALTNDDGYETAFEYPTRLWAAPGDLLIAMSSSGSSENILRACRAAKEAGSEVITLSGFAPDNPLRSIGKINFYVASSSYGHVETAQAALGHYLTDAAADFLETVGGH
jgi:D-sedoheptulose 7-phosphate isomerase